MDTEDIILAKLRLAKMSGGNDELFVEASRIYEVQRQNLDIAYLHRWAQSLGLQDLWTRLQAEVRPDRCVRLTKRHFVYVGLAALVVVSVLILYIGYVSWSPINRVSAARIQKGMTEQQVDAIFGGACSFEMRLPARAFGDKAFAGGSMKTWHSSRASCTVWFNTAGLVEGTAFHEAPGPGLFGRIRAFFPW
jgi:hypothetical protein